MRKKRVIIIGLVFLCVSAIVGACVSAWAHRSARNAPIPGSAWVATTDGTTTTATTRVTAVLRRHGIPSLYDSVIVADFYVPTDQVARARLVLALERLTHRDSVWRIH